MSVNQNASLEAAYVLHLKPYKDSSLLLDVFSAKHGRVGLVANGVRKKKGRWQSLLQPFVPIIVSWRGRSELQTVTDVEAAGDAAALSGRFLLSAFYVNELLTYFLHRHDASPDLFECYHTLIHQLATLDNGPSDFQLLEILLRSFEKRLLDETGYGLGIECCADTGEEIKPGLTYRYVFGVGPAITYEAAGDGVFSGESLIALQQGRLDTPDILRDAKRLLKSVIDRQLDGRPLKSRKLMLDLIRTAGK